jgi:hypothetical protein
MPVVRYAILAAAFAAAPAAHAIEEPGHTVLEKSGRFELRAYDPMIVATVEIDSSRRNAANEGFRPLADYIFGSNREKAKIEMTTPVVQARSVKIDMTAPVVQAPSGEGRWSISFVMPRQWTMDTLPEPVNPDVRITEQPGQLMATVRFSGSASPATQTEKQAELEAWIAARGWRVTGEAQTAFYDPPWTLPPFRRNEILIPVAPAAN